MQENQTKEKPSFTGIVRPLEVGDLYALRAIMAVWVKDRDTGRALPEEVEDNIREMQKSTSGQSDRKYFVAIEDGEVMGVIGYKNPDETMRRFAKTPKPAELINAYVKESVRKGRGVGTALVKKLEWVTRIAGFTEVELNSGPRYEHTGWGFYDKIGYERCGVAVEYYGPGGDAQVWRKEL